MADIKLVNKDYTKPEPSGIKLVNTDYTKPVSTVEKKPKIQVTKEQYKDLEKTYSALDESFKDIQKTMAGVSAPFDPLSIENATRVNVFGYKLDLPKIQKSKPADSEPEQPEQKPDDPYKALYKIKAKELNIGDIDLEQTSPAANLNKQKLNDLYLQDLNQMKNLQGQQLTDFVNQKKAFLDKKEKEEVAKIREKQGAATINLFGYDIGVYKPTLDNMYKAATGWFTGEEPADLEEVNVNSEYANLKSGLDEAARTVTFKNAPTLIKNIDSTLTLSDQQIRKQAEKTGNNILNSTNEADRVRFEAYEESGLKEGFGFQTLKYNQTYKDKLAYTGIQSEISVATDQIEEIVNIISEKNKKIEDLSLQLKEDPTNKAIAQEIQKIGLEIKPFATEIEKRKSFITKLSSATLDLSTIAEERIKQEEVDKRDLELLNEFGSSLGRPVGITATQLANSAIQLAKKGLILSGEATKLLGRNPDEVEITKQNILGIEGFKIPSRIKYGKPFELSWKEGEILPEIKNFNWDIAAPLILKTTAEAYLMRKIALPFGKLGAAGSVQQKVGRFAGLLAGSELVFGGDMFIREIEKGLSTQEALLVSSARVAAEAFTELANPLEFMPFDGINKKVFGKALTKADFVRYVGSNWKTMFPKIKAAGLDVGTFLFNFGKSVGMESFEEVMSDLGNYGIDEFVIKNIKPDYSRDNEFTLESEIETALTTALTMPLMSGPGAYYETKQSKYMPGLRWQASQNVNTFLANLKENFNENLITKEFYETGVKEVETLSNLYNANKAKIDLVPEDERVQYLDALYQYNTVSEQFLAETNESKKEKLADEVETALTKVQEFDKEYAPLVGNPQAQRSKAEERYIENIKTFGNPEDLKKASVEDLNQIKAEFNSVIEDPFSPTVAAEAQKHIDLIDAEIKAREEAAKQPPVEVEPADFELDTKTYASKILKLSDEDIEDLEAKGELEELVTKDKKPKIKTAEITKQFEEAKSLQGEERIQKLSELATEAAKEGLFDLYKQIDTYKTSENKVSIGNSEFIVGSKVDYDGETWEIVSIDGVGKLVKGNKTITPSDPENIKPIEFKSAKDLLGEEPTTDTKADIERRRDEKIKKLNEEQGYESQSDQPERIQIQKEYLEELAALEAKEPVKEQTEQVKNVKEALKALDEKELVTDPSDKNYYINKNNPSERYARVSTLKGEFDGTAGDSANRGTIIDNMLRDYVAGSIKTFEQLKQAYNKYSDKYEADEFTEDFLKDLFGIFQEIKEVTKNVELISDIPTMWGTLNGKPFAGTIDLLGIRNDGSVFIIDLKTSSQNRRDKEGRYYETYKEGDTIQQSAYAELLRQRTGIEIKNITILPIQVTKKRGRYISATSNKDEKGKFTMPVTIDRALFPEKKAEVKPTVEAKPIPSAEDLQKLAAEKLGKPIEKVIISKKLQSIAKRLTGEKYISKMNDQQRSTMEKYLLSLKSKKEIKEERLKDKEAERADNKKTVQESGLRFKLGNITAIWNFKTQSFEFYTTKYDKVKDGLVNLSASLLNKPNLLNNWWNDFASEKVKDAIIDAKYEFLDLLRPSNGIVDNDPTITAEFMLISLLKGMKFSLTDAKDFTDTSNVWFQKGARTISDFASDLVNDPLMHDYLLSSYDEFGLVDYIKDLINEYPEGITNNDVEEKSRKENITAIDLKQLEEEIATEYGVNLQTVLDKLDKELDEYEKQRNEQRRAEEEFQEEDPFEGPTDLQETFEETGGEGTAGENPVEVNTPVTGTEDAKDEAKENKKNLDNPVNPFRNAFDNRKGDLSASIFSLVAEKLFNLAKTKDLAKEGFYISVVPSQSIPWEQLSERTKKYFGADDSEKRLNDTGKYLVITDREGKAIQFTPEGEVSKDKGSWAFDVFPDTKSETELVNAKFEPTNSQLQKQGKTREWFKAQVKKIFEARKAKNTITYTISNVHQGGYQVDVENPMSIKQSLGDKKAIVKIAANGKVYFTVEGETTPNEVNRPLFTKRQIDTILHIISNKGVSKTDTQERQQFVTKLIGEKFSRVVDGKKIELAFKFDKGLIIPQVKNEGEKDFRNLTNEEFADILSKITPNVNKMLLETNNPFNYYDYNGKTVSKKVYPSYSDFIIDNFDTYNNIFSTEVKPEHFIEVGDPVNSVANQIIEDSKKPAEETTLPIKNGTITVKAPSTETFSQYWEFQVKDGKIVSGKYNTYFQGEYSDKTTSDDIKNPEEKYLEVSKGSNKISFKETAPVVKEEVKPTKVSIISTPVSEIVSKLNTFSTFQEKLEWLKENDLLTSIEINGKKYNTIDYHDRVMVLMKIGKYSIPFYISTGQAGKKNVKAGEWYVVFGIGTERGWINKGSEEQINNQYNFPLFQKMSRILNEGVGYIESRENNGNGKLKEGIGFLEFDNRNPKDVISFNNQMNLPTEPAGSANNSTQFYKHVNSTLNLLNSEIVSLKEQKEVKPAEVINESPVEKKPTKWKKIKTEDKIDPFKDSLNRSKTLVREVTPEQEAEAEAWFNTSPISKFINFRDMRNIVNSDAFATWKTSSTTLWKGGKFTDLYHEAWHEFSQLYLTKEQKKALYNEAMNSKEGKKALEEYAKELGKEVSKLTPLEKYFAIEEMIAEDFFNYALNKKQGKELILGQKPKRNSTFRKIWNYLKELFTGKTDLQTYYERLYTGQKLNNYTRSLDNTFFPRLNKGLEGVVDGEARNLTNVETKQLYQVLDYLFGQAFENPEGKNDSLPITLMFEKNSVASGIYKNALNTFQIQFNNAVDRIELLEPGTPEFDAEELNLNNLNFIIQNWSDVVKNHKNYSSFFKLSKDAIKFEEEGIADPTDVLDEENDVNNDRDSSVVKNENVSSKEAASNETVYLIATLATKNPNPFLPMFNLPVDFKQTWDILTKNLEGTLDYPELYEKIKNLQGKYSWAGSLLKRLPDPNKAMLTEAEQRLKSSFLIDIGKPKIDTYEASVDSEGRFSYSKSATTDEGKIKQTWSNNFTNLSPDESKFIEYDDNGTTYLNAEKLLEEFKNAFPYSGDKYKELDKKQLFADRIQFLSNFGIVFPEEATTSPEFFGFVTSFIGPIPQLYKLTKVLVSKEERKKVRNPFSDLRKINVNELEGTKILVASKIFTPLQKEALKYSEEFITQSVKNAANNTVWQIRDWNYISKIYNALNDVKKYPTYQSLINDSWLKQFDIAANPYVSGVILNSIFDLNPTIKKGNEDIKNPNYLQRRKDNNGNYVTVELQDYNGLVLNLKTGTKNEGKTTTDLTDFEKLVQNFNTLLLFGVQEHLRYGDKSSSFATKISHIWNPVSKSLEDKKNAPIVSIDKFVDKDPKSLIVLPSQGLLHLLTALKAELIPMKNNFEENIGSNWKFYKDNIKNLGIFEGILSQDTANILKKEYVQTKGADIKEVLTKHESAIQKDIVKYLEAQRKVLDKKLSNNLIKSDDFISSTLTKKAGESQLKAAYVLNSLLYNIEHTKMVTGDPRFYKSKGGKKDPFKRFSAWSATGRIFLTDEQTNNFIENKVNAIKDAVAKKLGITIAPKVTKGMINSVIFKDAEYNSKSLREEYTKYFLSKGYSQERIDEILKKYEEITEADGQGYMTLDEYKQSKLRAGSSHWTKAHEEAYQKEAAFVRGERIQGMSLEETALFVPQKWQYAGIAIDNGRTLPVFYKFSVAPLIPSMIKGKSFEKIHDNLVRQNVGLALFDSGSKISGVMNDTGEFNQFYSDYNKRTPYEGDYTINPIFYNYLKEQVNIEPELKEKVTFSSQMRKLLHINLFKEGKAITKKALELEKRFGDAIDKLISLEREKVISQMGAKFEDGKWTFDDKKLAEFFVKEFEERGLPDEVIDYFQVGENGKFVNPLDASNKRDKIENLLFSIANKRLIQQKINGEALIQLAATGFELETDKLKEVVEDAGLPFYRVVNGVTQAMKVKIAFSDRWKPLLKLKHPDGKTIDTVERLNEAIKDDKWLKENYKKITLVAVRIPVQGLNSQEFMEVYEFLPPSAGQVIVVSPYLVSKSGGDFDIDKLTTFFPNLNEEGNLYSTISEESIKKKYNSLLDKYKKAVAEGKDEAVDKLIAAIFNVSPEKLEKERKKELADEIFGEDGVPSFQKFRSFNLKKSYENEIVSIMRETLELEENFEQLISPNDTNLLDEDIDDLKASEEDKPKGTWTEVVEFAEIGRQFKSNLVGKSNLGIAAVWNTFFALSQRAGLVLNKKHIHFTSSGNEEKRDTRINLPHNETADGRISISGLMDVENKHKISKIFEQAINGFVDVAKDDWIFYINGVKEIVPTMLFTAAAGVNNKNLIAFYNQPILKRYVKEMQKYRNLFVKLKSSKLAENANNKALEDIFISTKGITDSTLQSKITALAEEIKKPTQKNGKDDPFARYKKLIAILDYLANKAAENKKLFTTEKLEQSVFQGKEFTPEENLMILAHFDELRDLGNKVSNFQRSLNADTKRAADSAAVYDRIQRLKQSRNSELFDEAAVARMFNDSTIKAFTNERTGFDKFISQFFTNVLEITNHRVFNDAIREIAIGDNELTFQNKTVNPEKFRKTLKNDFISYLYQNSAYLEDGITLVAKATFKLFVPKTALANELAQLKSKYPRLLENYPILSQLVPDTKQGDKPIINIKLKSKLTDRDELNSAVNQIRQLLQFNDVDFTEKEQLEVQAFAKKFVQFAIIQSGLNSSIYNLMDLVPNEEYTKIVAPVVKGFKETLDKNPDLAKAEIKKFYNQVFKRQNPSFYDFKEEMFNLNKTNIRGKNLTLNSAGDFTGEKKIAADLKQAEYIEKLPSKVTTSPKVNSATIKNNPNSLVLVENNAKLTATQGLKETNFASVITKEAIGKPLLDSNLPLNEKIVDDFINEIIEKSKNYANIVFNESGYGQHLLPENKRTFDYLSSKLYTYFGFQNPGFTPVEVQEVTIKPEFVGKIIYSTPGSGKTTLSLTAKNVIDTDNLIVEEMGRRHPNFKQNTGESIQDFIFRYVKEYDHKSEINAIVLEKSKKLAAEGKTVLTGTMAFIKDADIVFRMNPENERAIQRFGSVEKAKEFAAKEKQEVQNANKKALETQAIEKSITENLVEPTIPVVTPTQPSISVTGININTKSSDKLGRELTNPNWGAKNIMDIEAEYKANASKIKAPQLTMDEALKYDMNLMYKLQMKKFKAHPELVQAITDRGGVKFLEASEHTVGVKGSRWEGKGTNSNFIKVLIKSYQDSLEPTQSSTSVSSIEAIENIKKLNLLKLFMINHKESKVLKVGDKVEVYFDKSDSTSVLTIKSIKKINDMFKIELSNNSGKTYTYTVDRLGKGSNVEVEPDNKLLVFEKDLAAFNKASKEFQELKQVNQPFVQGKIPAPTISNLEKYTIARYVDQSVPEKVEDEGYKLTFDGHPDAIFYLKVHKFEDNEPAGWVVENVNTGYRASNIKDTAEQAYEDFMTKLTGAIENVDISNEKNVKVINTAGFDIEKLKPTTKPTEDEQETDGCISPI